jgi:hypothetical protein
MVAPAAMSLVVYTIGLPLLFFCILLRHRTAIRRDQVLRAADAGGTVATNPDFHVRRRYGELYTAFRPELSWYILVLLIRKVTVGVGVGVGVGVWRAE